MAPVLQAQESTSVEEVVVTASASAQQIRTAPASISVIGAEEIRQLAANDVLQAVRETQGITLDPTGGGSNRSSVSIRGMGRDYALMLVNGRRISASDEVLQHTDYRFDWVPMEMIERIEVVRGPMSSLYGSEAFGGVINVITRMPDQHWSADFRAQQGAVTSQSGGSEFNTSVAAAGPLTERWAASLSGAFFERADLPDPEDTRRPALSQREGKRGNNLVAGLMFTPVEGHRLDLDLYRSREDRWPYRLGTVSGSNIIFRNEIDIRRDHQALSYSGELGRLGMALSVYRSEVRTFTSRADERVGQPNSPRVGQRDDVVDGRFTTTLREQHQLSFGFELQRQSHFHRSFSGGRAISEMQAVYLQDQITLSEQWRVTLGMRADHNEGFGSELSPRAYLVYLPSDDLTLRAGYGHGFKAPHLKYTVPGYESGRPAMDLLPNPDLKPETVDGFELGIDYRRYWGRVGVTAFHNNLDNLLASQDLLPAVRDRGQVVANGEFWRINIDSARIRGTESVLALDLPQGLEITLNHTWLDTLDKSRNRALPNRPSHAFNARLGWHFADHWYAQLRTNYTGSQRIWVGFGANEAQISLPAYSQWHVSLARDFGRASTLRLGVDNLGDLRLHEKSEHFSYADRGRYAHVSLETRFR